MSAAHWACVNQQKEILKAVRPDIIVASSWGGAVALRCLELGYYSGPSILLAPAVQVRGWWSWIKPRQLFSLPQQAADKCMVLCGDADKIVCVRGVEIMCKRNGIKRFQKISGGDHRLNTSLIQTDRLRELIVGMLGSNLSSD